MSRNQVGIDLLLSICTFHTYFKWRPSNEPPQHYCEGMKEGEGAGGALAYMYYRKRNLTEAQAPFLATIRAQVPFLAPIRAQAHFLVPIRARHPSWHP